MMALKVALVARPGGSDVPSSRILTFFAATFLSRRIKRSISAFFLLSSLVDREREFPPCLSSRRHISSLRLVNQSLSFSVTRFNTTPLEL